MDISTVLSAIKDCLSLAQKTDNIPLAEKLIDAQKQIFDLMEENRELKEKLREAKETDRIAEKVVRHKDSFITLKDDPDKKVFCYCCWDKERKLIQVQVGQYATYQCQACKSYGCVDDEYAN